MSFKLIWLAEVLRSAGLKVVEQPGWKTRGLGDMGNVRGVMCHHTASSPKGGNTPALGAVQNGRGGPKPLRGPLSQLLLARDGTYYVVAAGLSNHAGPGNWKGITAGNRSFIGIEAENNGLGEKWPDVQMDAYVRGVGALLTRLGATEEMCVAHLEYALPVGRKSDPYFPGSGKDNRETRIKAFAAFRKRVGQAMTAAPAAALFSDEILDDGPGDIPTPDLETEGTAKVEATAAQDAAKDLSEAEINGVVGRLRAMKYHEVGLPDGKWGGRLAAGIAAFKNDRKLSGEPVIDEALMAELREAETEGWQRPISKERAEGVPEGSRVTDAATKQGWLGGGFSITAIGAYFSDYFEPVKPYLRPVANFAYDHWQLLLLGAGLLVIWQASRIWFARVQDHREGKTT
jgi:hypothetical protein